MDEKAKRRVSMVAVKALASERKSSIGLVGKSATRLKTRRQSYGFGAIPGVRLLERMSQVGIEFKRPVQIYTNTYQLDSHFHFNVPQVTKATNEVLDDAFNGHKYNPHESPAIAMRIAGEVMRCVKAMGFNRYRVITVCTIGQRRAQSYNNAVAFLWDHERDNYVDVTRFETTVFVQVTTFGIYLD